MITVAGIAGSLRRGSHNRALLNAAFNHSGGAFRHTVLLLDSIPLYNADIEKLGFPDPVQRLRESVLESEAVLIVSPEYNEGIPGVMKNAIDWLSRGPRPKPLWGKPCAIMGASPSRLGTARMQGQLSVVLGAAGALVMPQPRIYVMSAAAKFDDKGELIDDPTAALLDKFMLSFAEWVRTVRP